MERDTESEHAWFHERIAAFVAGGLTPSELARFGAHQADCAECAAELEKVLTIDRSMKEAFANAGPGDGFEERLISGLHREEARAKTALFSPFMRRAAALSAAAVLIGLALYVVSKSPQQNTTKVAEISPVPAKPLAEPKHRPTLDEIINDNPKQPDPNSKESSDIVVPPDILAKAELGDHFEMINPDKPDTHSTLGNPDAHPFHDSTPPSDPAGGGGTDGIALDDLIGVGGTASKGTGGGFGGGDGTGVGVDRGAGQGSFGNRSGGGRKLMVKRHGGSAATENAVDKALQWLAAHQEADGHWDAKKYGAAGDRDTTVTSLALMAFLGAGHSEKVGVYKENVQRAISWLSHCPVDGTINTDFLPGIIATIALSEASGMARIPETTATAQKMLDAYTQENGTANPWFANVTSEADFTLTGWYVMMLKSAKAARLKVDPRAFESALKFLDSAEKRDPDTKASRYGFIDAGKEFKSTGSTCAIGNFARLQLSLPVENLKSSVELFIKESGTPTDNPDLKTAHFEYWYFGTLCAFEQTGDSWKRWNEELKKALVPNQLTTGDDAGSWNFTGPDAHTFGRAGQTALGALCLETYYRYWYVR
jgi:hypothetical protein